MIEQNRTFGPNGASAWGQRFDAYEAKLWQLRWGEDGRIIGISDPLNPIELKFRSAIRHGEQGWKGQFADALKAFALIPMTYPPSTNCPVAVVRPATLESSVLVERLMVLFKAGDHLAFESPVDDWGNVINDGASQEGVK